MLPLRTIQFLLVLIVGSETTVKNRILSDSYASPDDYPYMVSIRIKGQHVCGGSIIDFRWVLTATHCFSKTSIKSPREVHVLAGTFDLTGIGGSLHPVENIFVHPNFTIFGDNQGRGDIALLKLFRPFRYSSTLSSINLGRLSGDRSNVVFVGWGAESEGATRLSIILKAVDMVTIPGDGACLEDDTHICAVAPAGMGMCVGDTGGPLIDAATETLVGIASYRTKECGSGLADVFTRVYPYWSWINYIKIFK